MYKVLIVDDEVWMRNGLKKVIEESSTTFRVAALAKNGEEALSVLETERIDVIISDIRMPRLSGLEMLEELRNRKLAIPVIYLSGFNEFDYVRKALRMQAVDYLLKPLNRDDVCKVLDKVAQQLLKQQAQQLEEDREEDVHRGPEVVDFMKRRIENNYMQELSISGLSQEVGFNPSYLSRLFKQETGKGFVRYLTEYRMQAAMTLLQNPHMTVVDTAHRVGFWDEKHFSKMFKKYTGFSPSEYREHQGAVK